MFGGYYIESKTVQKGGWYYLYKDNKIGNRSSFKTSGYYFDTLDEAKKALQLYNSPKINLYTIYNIKEPNNAQD